MPSKYGTYPGFMSFLDSFHFNQTASQDLSVLLGDSKDHLETQECTGDLCYGDTQEKGAAWVWSPCSCASGSLWTPRLQQD